MLHSKYWHINNRIENQTSKTLKSLQLSNVNHPLFPSKYAVYVNLKENQSLLFEGGITDS